MLTILESKESWSDKYKLRIVKGQCPKCGVGIETTVPFAFQGYRGLKSEDHGCGEKYTRKIMVAVSKEEKDFWAVIAESM